MAQRRLPVSSDIDTDQEPRVVSLDDADGMIDVLGSETARGILAALDDEPMAPSELADSVGTSLQNASYHLRRLTEADLVEVVGTRYSPRGLEMDVYAPVSSPTVIYAGDDGSEDAVASVLGERPDPVGSD